MEELAVLIGGILVIILLLARGGGGRSMQWDTEMEAEAWRSMIRTLAAKSQPQSHNSGAGFLLLLLAVVIIVLLSS
jgi:hypothetical protein